MRTWKFRTAPLLSVMIMALAAGRGTASGPAPQAAEEPDITVAAVPATDLAGLYIAQDVGSLGVGQR